ncbi:MAG: hypothetical protein HC880_02695 [Bacteroidia bacterium]|nr:hypothetical protein [Bacteroidia bacterium]
METLAQAIFWTGYLCLFIALGLIEEPFFKLKRKFLPGMLFKVDKSKFYFIQLLSKKVLALKAYKGFGADTKPG